MSSRSESERRWSAVLARDARADGQFYFAVRTTGVYCRPACPARRPRRENVLFFDSCAQAEAAGFRACKRCRPLEASAGARDAERIARACRMIERATAGLPLARLAAACGLSPFHFHRRFKAVTGLTPKAYANEWRARRMRAALDSAPSVTDAIYAAGFQSNGRFYEASSQVLGMPPRDFRRRGERSHIRFAIGQCSLGAILVAATGRGVCAVMLGDDPEALLRELQDRFARAELVGADAGFEQLMAQVVACVDDPRLGLALPLDVRGTAFQQRVWRALRKIGPGSTASYAEIAARIGRPGAARAVARACATNPVALAIPCHRVVRTDGELSGYRWGIERKRALLARERAGASAAAAAGAATRAPAA